MSHANTWMGLAKLSIIVPAYNEERTIGTVLARIREVSLPLAREVIVVDDGSTDRTSAVARQHESADGDLVVLRKPNGGKGSAVRYGLERATGDVVVIQDADLEVDPREYVPLLAPFLREGAEVVYGSRFLGQPWRWTLGELANRFLSGLTSVLYGARITDMETSHKMMAAHVVRQLRLEGNGFEIEPEITAKLLRCGRRIREVPIEYRPRSREEGKKIGWRDGVIAVRTLWRWRLARMTEIRRAPADRATRSGAPAGTGS